MDLFELIEHINTSEIVHIYMLSTIEISADGTLNHPRYFFTHGVIFLNINTINTIGFGKKEAHN